MDELFPEFLKNRGEVIKAWCCDKELDCIVKIFSNGSRHAWGTCPICGKTNAKQQRLDPTIESLSHRLMWIKVMICSMKNGEDKDECVAMVERLCVELEREIQ